MVLTGLNREREEAPYASTKRINFGQVKRKPAGTTVKHAEIQTFQDFFRFGLLKRPSILQLPYVFVSVY